MTLPLPPKEVPLCSDEAGLAPAFRRRLDVVIQEMHNAGYDAVVSETTRTQARQDYLAGFGREYDDGRGVVTHAMDAWTTWHFYGLAADVISRSKGWDAPEAFWGALRTVAHDEGLASGGDWEHPDRPHVQWGYPMRVAPSERAVELYKQGGVQAVWKEVRADG